MQNSIFFVILHNNCEDDSYDRNRSHTVFGGEFAVSARYSRLDNRHPHADCLVYLPRTTGGPFASIESRTQSAGSGENAFRRV